MSQDLWTKHRATVERNYQILEGKESLLKTWEACEDADPEYLRELRKRVHQMKLRILALKPIANEEDHL